MKNITGRSAMVEQQIIPYPPNPPSQALPATNGRSAVVIAALKARLRAIERADQELAPSLTTGITAMDRSLPGGRGLPARGLHEIIGPLAAATGFAAALAGRYCQEHDCGTILWITADARLYAPGLTLCGVDPARLLLVRSPQPQARLWAMIEALRTPGIAAVVAEIPQIDAPALQQLQTAAEQSKASGFLLRAPDGGRTDAGVAITRWQVSAAAGHGRQVGRPYWRVALLPCRAGGLAEARGSWTVEMDDATGAFALAAPLGHRPGGAASTCLAG